MSEPKFKVGDKVKVVAKRSSQFGKKGVVVGYEDTSFPFAVKFDEVLSHNWFKASELELVSETKEDEIKGVSNKLKFKVGDKVKVLNSTIFSYRKNGEVGTIIKPYYSEPTYDVKFETADEDGDYELMFNEDELELFKEPTMPLGELLEKFEEATDKLNANQPLKDAFKELLNISEQLSEFNKKNNTKLRIIVE